MVTVGLIKELLFISQALSVKVKVDITTDFNHPLTLFLENGNLTVFYLDQKIWRENLTGQLSFFGVESCDSIARIVRLMNNNQFATAKDMFYDFEIDKFSIS